MYRVLIAVLMLVLTHDVVARAQQPPAGQA
jgi:hypothetical protein